MFVCLAFSSSSSSDCLSVCLFVLFVYLSAFDFFVVSGDLPAFSVAVLSALKFVVSTDLAYPY